MRIAAACAIALVAPGSHQRVNDVQPNLNPVPAMLAVNAFIYYIRPLAYIERCYPRPIQDGCQSAFRITGHIADISAAYHICRQKSLVLNIDAEWQGSHVDQCLAHVGNIHVRLYTL